MHIYTEQTLSKIALYIYQIIKSHPVILYDTFHRSILPITILASVQHEQEQPYKCSISVHTLHAAVQERVQCNKTMSEDLKEPI